MATNGATAVPQSLPAKIPMKLPATVAAKTLSSILPILSAARYVSDTAEPATTLAAPLRGGDARQDEKTVDDAAPQSVPHGHGLQQAKRQRDEAADQSGASSRSSSVSSSSSLSSVSSSTSSSSLSSSSSSDDDSSSSSSNSHATVAVHRRAQDHARPPRRTRARKVVQRRRRPAASRSFADADEDEDAPLLHVAQQSDVLDEAAETVPHTEQEQQRREEVSASQTSAAPPRPPVMRSFPADIDKAIERCKERLNREENAVRIKDDNKAVSLGTSKINYIDPRIICSWASAQGVPIKKIFSATLMNKFPWALNASNFNF